MNQGRTKERPKNSQTEKVRFINIAVSFTSLIPCLPLPRDDRENTERRARLLLHNFLHKSLHNTKKCCNFAVTP